jgi:Tfp pilus assembly protein PilV
MSVIEVMVVLVIVTTGIAGAYQVVNSGTRLADTTESRIQAIAYAREGLEGVENIRDTNWIKFSSDFAGCFDVFGFDVTCV